MVLTIWVHPNQPNRNGNHRLDQALYRVVDSLCPHTNEEYLKLSLMVERWIYYCRNLPNNHIIHTRMLIHPSINLIEVLNQ